MKRVIWLALMVASPLAMATESTPEQTSAAETKLDRDLRMTDTDRDGSISRAEAEQAKAQLLVTNFDKIDADKNGALDRTEIKGFLEAVQKAIQAQQDEHLKEFSRRLKAADKNKNGKLTKKELAAAKDKLPSLESNFDAIDANHDKSITMEEILAFAKNGQPQQ